MPPSPVPSAFARHRGFDLRLRAGAGSYAFEVGHDDLTLHASPSEYQTVHSAVRAARQFVDDALRVFSSPSAALAA